MSPRIWLGLLGPFEVQVRGEELPVGGPRARSLLAGLAASPGRVVTVDQLVEYVWGAAAAPGSAPTQIRNRVSTLRRLFADTLGEPVIDSAAAGYVLRPEAVTRDLDAFDRHIHDAQGQSPPRAAATLTAALDLWRGPALDGLDSPGLSKLARGLDERRLSVREQLIDLELQQGNGPALIGELVVLAEANPFREQTAAQLMIALAQAGRRAEALALFAEVRTRFADDLGLDPGPALVAAQAQILRGAPAPAPPPAATPTRDLPADVAGFTGRATELDFLDRAHAHSAMTLVAICGPAGAGKTALAVHWAHQTIESFPDGQIYVDLRGYSADRTLTTGETLTRILSSLGVPDRDIPTGWAGKVSFYRTQTAGRRLLLLLDNARSADQVRALLPGGPGCAVLVTSRATLRGLVARNGAQHLELGLLSAAEATRLLRATVGTARITADPAATGTLVDMCHGLPLALRIVAADLVTHPGVPLDAYAAELARRTPLSALDVPGDAEASLRAAFDLSFHALTPPAQRLFPLLGLAPGPDFGTAAAVALTGRPRPEVETALRELVDAHLVERPRPERFRLHDLLRQYAIQRATASVPPTERAAAIERLYGWHVRSADACTRLLYPHVTMRMPIPAGPAVAPRTTAEALDWLAEESVVHVALAHADGPPELVWLLADALRSYFNRHAGQDTWLSVAGAARAAARAVAAAHPDRVDAWTGAASAALSLAYAHHCAADKEQAAVLINEATGACDRAQWTQGRSAAVNLLGMIRHDQGRLADAATCYEQALALDRRLGNDADVAIDLNNLGRVYQDMGRLDRAAAHYRTALRHHERAGAASAAAICRTNLGHVRLLGGSHRAAFSLLQQALSEHRDYGDRQGEAYATGGLALAQLHLGQLRDAEQSARSAVELAQGLGAVITADAYIVLGAVRRRLGDIERARQAYAEALSYADDCTYAYGKVQALLGLDAFAEAATAARQGGFRLLESQALWALARRRRQLGPPARGRKMLRVARGARIWVFDQSGRAFLTASQADS